MVGRGRRRTSFSHVCHDVLGSRVSVQIVALVKGESIAYLRRHSGSVNLHKASELAFIY